MEWRTRTVSVVAAFAVALALRAANNEAPPRLSVWHNSVVEEGIRSLSGADGVTEFAQIGSPASPALRAKAGSSYLYFAVDRPVSARPIYVLVRYYDNAVGPGLRLEYDSRQGDSLPDKYRLAEEQAGGWAAGARKWKWVAFRLDWPRFAHRQNLGADFRLAAGSVAIAEVRLESGRPSSWKELDRVDVTDVRPLVKIGEGGQLIVGGFDPARAEDGAPQARALEGAIPALKSLGVTSHEGYVRWNLCEPKEGVFDWTVYDRFVEVYKRHKLKWVPFLIAGSAYSLPDWYHKKPGAQGYVCLEHGQESDVQSLWNPALRRHVARFIKAFCDHYRASGVIESILLGITGNYGEAIYPVTGNDWTADIHGAYHSHPGYWAGDRYAAASFRVWLGHKYSAGSALQRAWRSSASRLSTARPFLKKNAPNDRAWLDMCGWYIDSMTDWARFWLSVTRKNFPKGDIYLCTGGHAPPEHGSDFGEQCKVAAEFGAGVRITNEGSSYRANFTLTRWVASASRQYGAYFSFEPAGEVDANGVIARIYNAAASGARGLHYYYPNLFATEPARANFVKWGPAFTQCRPLTEIGVYYPETCVRLTGRNVLPDLEPLRDRFDFSYISDGQIRDGGLAGIKVLVVLEGNVAETEVLQAMLEWARKGGALVVCAGAGDLRTVEGDTRFQRLLVDSRLNRVHVVPPGSAAKTHERIVRALSQVNDLSPATRAMLNLDGSEDGVFATAIGHNSLLWLNYTGAPRKVGDINVPPYSIVNQSVGAGAARGSGER